MAYLKFVSMAFQRSMAYRVEYYAAILNAFLYIVIFTSVWKALIPVGETKNGLSRDDMILYAVLSTIIKVSFARHDSILGTRVKTGEIAVDLMKPFNFPLMYFCDTAGVSLFQIFARSIPIFIFSIFIFDINIDVSALTLLQFVPVFFLAFILFFSLSFLISSLAFYFVDIFPFWIFYFSMITLSSGAIIPLDFFPDTISIFLKQTPFPYLFYYPTMMILGKSGMPTFAELILRYVLLIGGSLSLALLSYRYGLRKLSIAGG